MDQSVDKERAEGTKGGSERADPTDCPRQEERGKKAKSKKKRNKKSRSQSLTCRGQKRRRDQVKEVLLEVVWRSDEVWFGRVWSREWS